MWWCAKKKYLQLNWIDFLLSNLLIFFGEIWWLTNAILGEIGFIKIVIKVLSVININMSWGKYELSLCYSVTLLIILTLDWYSFSNYLLINVCVNSSTYGTYLIIFYALGYRTISCITLIATLSVIRLY